MRAEEAKKETKIFIEEVDEIYTLIKSSMAQGRYNCQLQKEPRESTEYFFVQLGYTIKKKHLHLPKQDVLTQYTICWNVQSAT